MRITLLLMSSERKDITVKLPRQLDADVDKFITTKKGKRFINKTDFYKQAVRSLLEQYEGKSHIESLGFDEFERIILNDHDSGHIVTLEVKSKNNEKILMCNTCSDPDCPHRKFVLKSSSYWHFLDSHDLKLVRVRDKD